ncbi:hypothetical protein LINPERPRIM_LOCUS7763, partial [Linum perenne]
ASFWLPSSLFRHHIHLPYRYFITCHHVLSVIACISSVLPLRATQGRSSTLWVCRSRGSRQGIDK